MKKHSIKRRKTGGGRKLPKYKRSVSIKSAEKILRSYYRKKNKGNNIFEKYMVYISY